LLLRTETKTQSPSFALAIAISIARWPTHWPMPLSPSTTALVRVSLTIFTVGRGLVARAANRFT
jgi:hypothetical protein